MISIRIGSLFIIQSNFKFNLDKHWLLNFCNKIKKQNTCGCKKIIKLSLLMVESYSFLSQAREPWITFSKVFAIQYDACHGRLNLCGGRLHSLRPVVSRLCFFSLPLHLISNPKFQSYSTSTHFLFEFSSSSSDSPIQNFNHILHPPTFCSNWTFYRGLPLVTNLRSLFRYWKNVGSCGTFSTWERLQKKLCSLVWKWNQIQLMFLIPLFVSWTQVCLWELSDRSKPLAKKFFLTCLNVESNPAYVPDTSVRPLNSSLSLGIVRSKPLPSPELIFFPDRVRWQYCHGISCLFFFSVVCWLHFSAWSCWIKPTVKHKNKPIKLQETEIEKKIPNKLKENKIRIAF